MCTLAFSSCETAMATQWLPSSEPVNDACISIPNFAGVSTLIAATNMQFYCNARSNFQLQTGKSYLNSAFTEITFCTTHCCEKLLSASKPMHILFFVLPLQPWYRSKSSATAMAKMAPRTMVRCLSILKSVL